MNVIAVPKVGSKQDAPDVSSSRSSSKSRSDDVSPFASLFAQAQSQSTAPPSRDAVSANGRQDSEGASDSVNAVGAVSNTASSVKNVTDGKREPSAPGPPESSPAGPPVTDVSGSPSVKSSALEMEAMLPVPDAALPSVEPAPSPEVETSLQTVAAIQGASGKAVASAPAPKETSPVELAAATQDVSKTTTPAASAIADATASASETPEAASATVLASQPSEKLISVLVPVRPESVADVAQVATPSQARLVDTVVNDAEAKSADPVMSAPVAKPVGAASDMSQTESNATYVRLPDASETAVDTNADDDTTPPDPARGDTAVKASVRSTAKYVSGSDTVSKALDQTTDDLAADEAAPTNSTSKGQIRSSDLQSGASSSPEVKFGEIVITPLSKADTGHASQSDSAASSGRQDSTPLVVPGTEKVVSAKTGVEHPALSAERPTLATVSDFTIKSVRYLVTNGEKTITVRLVPESLGELRLEVTSNDTSVSVRMISANPTVRDALQGQIHGLKEALSRDGITVAQATVSAQMSSDHASKGFAGRQSQSPEFGYTPSWRRAPSVTATEQWVRAPRPVRTHSGVLNLYA